MSVFYPGPKGASPGGWTVIWTLMASLMRSNNSWALLALQKFRCNQTQITIHKDFQWVLERSKHAPWPLLSSCPVANDPIETNSLLYSAGSKPDSNYRHGRQYILHSPTCNLLWNPLDLTNSPAISNKLEGSFLCRKRMVSFPKVQAASLKASIWKRYLS